VASLALPWFAPPEILSLKVATFKGGRSGIPQPNVATRYRFFADRRQEPCQRWRQLGIDEEPHFIRLSDEDRMVEILGGVL
jgi:hypothetical protein